MYQSKEYSLVDTAILYLNSKFQENKYSVCSTLLFGFLTYFFIFSNKLPNYDDIYFMLKPGLELGWATSQGRWGLDVFSYIIPKYSMPWLCGMISIAIMSIAITILVKIFEVKNRYMQIILSAVIVTFPAQLAVFINMFMSIPYSLAFLFSSLSLASLKKDTFVGYIWGCIWLVLSMSIYQGFISMVSSLLIVIVIRKLLCSKDNCIKIVINYLTVLFISFVLYICAAKLFLTVFSISFNSYTSARIPNNLGYVLGNLLFCYSNFFDIIGSGEYGLVDTLISRYCHNILIIILIFCILHSFLRNMESTRMLTIVLCFALLPLSINIFSLAGRHVPHALTVHGFIALYFIMSMMIDIKKSKKLYDIITILLFLIVTSNIFYVNKKSLHLYLQYENYYSYTVTLLTRIQGIPDFDSAKKLAIIGVNYEKTYRFKEFSPDQMHRQNKPWLSDIGREQFIKYYCGFDMLMATNVEKFFIALTDEYKAMNTYPSPGSIKKIGSYIVVKMADKD